MTRKRMKRAVQRKSQCICTLNRFKCAWSEGNMSFRVFYELCIIISQFDIKKKINLKLLRCPFLTDKQSCLSCNIYNSFFFLFMKQEKFKKGQCEGKLQHANTCLQIYGQSWQLIYQLVYGKEMVVNLPEYGQKWQFIGESSVMVIIIYRCIIYQFMVRNGSLSVYGQTQQLIYRCMSPSHRS